MREENMETSVYRPLITQAIQALEYSYAPYSHFTVGAALEDGAGHIWRGCNIESAAYSPTCCAERTALFKAVSEGVRDFRAIAIVGKNSDRSVLSDSFTAPCGVCRQALAEFCDGDFPIILVNGKGTVQIWTLAEMLPLRFTRKNIE